MESKQNTTGLNTQDITYIDALKNGAGRMCYKFFYEEIVGILHRIRVEVFRGQVDYDEMVNELYLYLSKDNWAKFNGFEAMNGCRLRTWMIPVAWRFFISKREYLIKSEVPSEKSDTEYCSTNDDLRIQIAIDVNAVLTKMPNQRYAEIIRLLLIEGFAPTDVADMLGMKVDNVYNLKHRAIGQFVELYGDRN